MQITQEMFEIADEFAKWRNTRDLAHQANKLLGRISEKAGKSLVAEYLYFDNNSLVATCIEFNQHLEAAAELVKFAEEKMEHSLDMMKTALAKQGSNSEAQTTLNMLVRGRKEKKESPRKSTKHTPVDITTKALPKPKEPPLLALISRPR